MGEDVEREKWVRFDLWDFSGFMDLEEIRLFILKGNSLFVFTKQKSKLGLAS